MQREILNNLQEVTRIENDDQSICGVTNQDYKELISALIKQDCKQLGSLLYNKEVPNQLFDYQGGKTTLLILAIKLKLDKQIIKLLIKHGADTEAKDSEGNKAFYYVKSHQEYSGALYSDPYLEEIANLVNGKRKVVKDFIDSAQKGDLIDVERCLDNGIDPDSVYESKMTALLQSSYYGRLQVVKMLIERGADINLMNKHQETALSVAIAGRNREVTKFIVENGADLKHVKNGKDMYKHARGEGQGMYNILLRKQKLATSLIVPNTEVFECDSVTVSPKINYCCHIL